MDLRDCLEACLSEDASPAVLEQHLPRVREIIIALLQGLKLKQAEYKQYLLRNRSSQNIPPAAAAAAVAPAPAPSSSSPTKPEQKRVSERPLRQGTTESSVELAEESSRRSMTPSLSRRPMNAPPVEAAGTRLSLRAQAPAQGHSSRPSVSLSDPRRTPILEEEPIERHTLTDAPVSFSSPTSSYGSPSIRHAPSASVPVNTPDPQASEHRKTTSSVSRLPTIEATSPFEIESIESIEAASSDPSLKALKSRDALERRASKRFSAYTFNKMGIGQGYGHGFGSGNLGMSMLSMGATPSTTVASSPATSNGTADRKGSFAKRPSRLNIVNNNADIPAGSPSNSDTSLSQSKMKKSSSLDGSVDEPLRRRSPKNPPHALPAAERHYLSPSAASSSDSLPFVDASTPRTPEEEKTQIPPVPPLPSPDERARLDAIQNRTSRASSTLSEAAPMATKTPTQASYPAPSQNRLNVYLQLGRHTRKATIDVDPSLPAGGITVASLRMLFVDRFAYSPGQDDFPTIYIKDPNSGVSYELEDLGDISNDTLLTLNIERESIRHDVEETCSL